MAFTVFAKNVEIKEVRNMTINELDRIYCSKCGKTLNKKQFYTSNNLEKYPDGIVPICKKCLTMHVDNFDSSTYL